jgi:hypothetical protein
MFGITESLDFIHKVLRLMNTFQKLDGSILRWKGT